MSTVNPKANFVVPYWIAAEGLNDGDTDDYWRLTKALRVS